MLDEQPNAVVCAVFVPVMFLAGRTGLLFRELAGAMIAAIAFSGFVALSLAPMLCSNSGRKRDRIAQWVDDRFQRLEHRQRSQRPSQRGAGEFIIMIL